MAERFQLQSSDVIFGIVSERAYHQCFSDKQRIDLVRFRLADAYFTHSSGLYRVDDGKLAATAVQEKYHIFRIVCSRFKNDKQINFVKCINLGFKELKALVAVSKGKRRDDDNAILIDSGNNVSSLCKIDFNIYHRVYRPLKYLVLFFMSLSFILVNLREIKVL